VCCELSNINYCWRCCAHALRRRVDGLRDRGNTHSQASVPLPLLPRDPSCRQHHHRHEQRRVWMPPPQPPVPQPTLSCSGRIGPSRGLACKCGLCVRSSCVDATSTTQGTMIHSDGLNLCLRLNTPLSRSACSPYSLTRLDPATITSLRGCTVVSRRWPWADTCQRVVQPSDSAKRSTSQGMEQPQMMEQCSAVASSAQLLAFEGQRCCDNCVTSCVCGSAQRCDPACVALAPSHPTRTDIKAARLASGLMRTAGLIQLVSLNLPRASLVEGQPPRIIAFHDNARTGSQ